MDKLPRTLHTYQRLAGKLFRKIWDPVATDLRLYQDSRLRLLWRTNH
jgi:hypothetical protein